MPYLIILVIVILVELYCLLKQRAILEISRYADCGIDLRKLIIPVWYNIAWLTPFVAIYLLCKILPEYPWYYCVGIYLLYFVGTAALFPVPKFMYKSVVDELESKMQDSSWRMMMAFQGLKTYKLRYALNDLQEIFYGKKYPQNTNSLEELTIEDNAQQPIDKKQHIEQPDTQLNSSERAGFKHKPYKFLAFAILVVVLIITAMNMTTQNPKNSQSKNFKNQSQQGETKYDLLARSKPMLESLTIINKNNNNMFKSELEAYAEISKNAEKPAKDAIKLLTGTEQKFFCEGMFDNFEAPNQEYNIYSDYLLPDTVTYPQKDIMDFWTATVVDLYINKYYQNNDMVMLNHVQFNKQKNETRTVERRVVFYRNNKPVMFTSKSEPRLNVTEEEKTFKKTGTPWQQFQNERLRKFYELF